MKKAPLASVKVVQLERMIFEDGLASGRVDLYIGIPGVQMPECHVRRFFEDELVCVARRNSGVVRTLDQFLARGHIKMELSPGRGAEVDAALASLHCTRHVVLTVPNFSSALDVVARSDLLTVAPRSIASAHPAGLRVTKLPVDVAPLSISMFWHRRVHADSAVRALRDGLLALVGPDRRLKVT